MKFEFKKRINTEPGSIFYSAIKYKDKIHAFCRKEYAKPNSQNTRVIEHFIFNEDFDIVEKNKNTFIGEDPRCFIYNNKLYILDNYLSDMYLIDYDTNKYIKINIDGKNISFFSHNGILFFIHYIKPFSLYAFNIDTGEIRTFPVNDDKRTYNYEYRGGTPGYKLNDKQYYGFGHRTYKENDIVKHDIFKWVVNFEPNKLPTITQYDIPQPLNSKNICDPTSVIEIDNKKYLITAETEKEWFVEQDYITNVYEIIED